MEAKKNREIGGAWRGRWGGIGWEREGAWERGKKRGAGAGAGMCGGAAFSLPSASIGEGEGDGDVDKEKGAGPSGRVGWWAGPATGLCGL